MSRITIRHSMLLPPRLSALGIVTPKVTLALTDELEPDPAGAAEAALLGDLASALIRALTHHCNLRRWSRKGLGGVIVNRLRNDQWVSLQRIRGKER